MYRSAFGSLGLEPTIPDATRTYGWLSASCLFERISSGSYEEPRRLAGVSESPTGCQVERIARILDRLLEIAL